MFTKQELKEQLMTMGLKPNDTVLIHTSFKSVGEVEGGIDGFLDAFCEYLSEGLFLVPTHTWNSVSAKNPVYDVSATVPCVGAVTKVAAFRKDGVRSLHPTHSLWAHGKDAEEFVRNEENAGSPAAPGFCWDKIGDRNAKILLIGVTNNRNTFIHSVDERIGLEDRLQDPPFPVTIIDRDGNRLQKTTRLHHCSKARDVSLYYVNFEKPMVELGAQTFGKLGNAEVRIIEAKKCREIVERIYSRATEDLFTDFHEIPEVWYREE